MLKNKGEIIKKVGQQYKKENINPFFVGDTIKVHFKIKEGKRERIQIFQGIVIAFRGNGISKSFVVRKISFNVGVEKIFPLHSPKIDNISIVQRGKVRRAKLYYLRNLFGKSFQVKRFSRQEEKRLEEKINANK